MVTENDGFLLPELSEEDKVMAESHDGKLFALDLLNPDKLGQFSWINGLGVALQNVGKDTLRCICIYDDPPAYRHLALINASVSAVGGVLEFGDFTVRKQWVPRDEENEPEEEIAPQPTGMEVA